MLLIPCRDCARHVDAGGRHCPFCDAVVTRGRPRTRVLGQVTRAMIFYASALAGCAEPATEEPPVEVTAVEVAVPMAPTLAPDSLGIDPPSIVAHEVRVELEPEPRAEALAQRRHAEGQKNPPPRVIQRVIDPWRDNSCCPPYGAPAFDFDLV